MQHRTIDKARRQAVKSTSSHHQFLRLSTDASRLSEIRERVQHTERMFNPFRWSKQTSIQLERHISLHVPTATSEAPLGRGTYGIVLRGTRAKQPVAIKFSIDDPSHEIERACLRRLQTSSTSSSTPRLYDAFRLCVEYVAADQLELPTTLRNASTSSWLSRMSVRFVLNVLVMECAGSSILTELAPPRTLAHAIDTCKLTKRLGRHVLRALSHVHSQQIVHADIKPENILFANDRTLDIRLVDFGLSRIDDDLVNDGGAQTISYRAPEVAFQLTPQVTPKIDMFSFGCVLFEIMTGTLLFEVDDLEQMKQKLATGLFDSPPRAIALESSPSSWSVQSELMLRRGLFRVDDFVAFQQVLSNLLIWNVADRWTADQCLAHPFFDDDDESHGTVRHHS